MHASRLPEARQLCPLFAADEAHAERQLRVAVATGDVAAGAKALADWIDAQVGMLVYLELYGTLEGAIEH